MAWNIWYESLVKGHVSLLYLRPIYSQATYSELWIFLCFDFVHAFYHLCAVMIPFPNLSWHSKTWLIFLFPTFITFSSYAQSVFVYFSLLYCSLCSYVTAMVPNLYSLQHPCVRNHCLWQSTYTQLLLFTDYTYFYVNAWMLLLYWRI